jgi:hypothetical protein
LITAKRLLVFKNLAANKKATTTMAMLRIKSETLVILCFITLPSGIKISRPGRIVRRDAKDHAFFQAYISLNAYLP